MDLIFAVNKEINHAGPWHSGIEAVRMLEPKACRQLKG